MHNLDAIICVRYREHLFHAQKKNNPIPAGEAELMETLNLEKKTHNLIYK